MSAATTRGRRAGRTRSSVRLGVVAPVAMAALAALSALGAYADSAGGQAPVTADRSTILLRYDCRSQIGRREVTLFANGTVRLRDGLPEDPKMFLGELGPVALEQFRNRLLAEDLQEVESGTGLGVDGAWVEECTLYSALPKARVFKFGRYDSLQLALAHVVTIATDIAATVDPRAGSVHLPAGYLPRTGDVLRRSDGALFRIVGSSLDRMGFELSGVIEPLTLYMPTGQLSQEFVELVSREREQR